MGDEVVRARDLRARHHLRDVQAVEHDITQVSGTHGIPGILDVILPEGDVDSRLGQFLHAGDTSALRVGVDAPLEVRIDQRIRHEVDATHLEQAHQAQEVRIVVGVHCRRVRGGHSRPNPGLECARGQGFQPARGLVVDFVAVHVHEQSVLLRKLDCEVQRGDGVLAGELKVRDGADCIHAHFRRAAHKVASVREGLDAFLREGNQLQGHGVLKFLTQVNERTKGRQVRVGHVDVRAHVLDAELGLLTKCAARAILDVLVGQALLALAPHLDALKEGSAFVVARLSRGQRRIQVNVGFDIGGQHQLARVVADLFAFTRRQSRADFRELSVRDADVDSGGSVFNADTLDEQVRSSVCGGAHRRIPFSIALPTK